MPFSLIAEPTDVAYLASILETIYARRQIEDLAEREECARQLVALFASGVTNRRELLHRMGVIH